MMTLLDDVIIFSSRLLWYLSCFMRFSVDLLNNFENFISVIIVHFIFYDLSLVIFAGFMGGSILSFLKALLRVFTDTILFTLFIRLYYIPDDGSLVSLVCSYWYF